MTLPDWQKMPIAKSHNRAGFDCGEPDLNDFVRRHARQTHARGGAKTFVAAPLADPSRVLGFYSLSPGSLAFKRAPSAVSRGLARHDLPIFRLARLAVSVSVQGQGLGGQLLLAAGRRCLRVASEVGGVAVLIDAKSDRVATWYESFGAVPLLDAP